MFESFDYATYRHLLRWLSRDRPCVGFPAALEIGSDPYCVVRHDIDYSLSSALRMAEVEFELGIKATYFLLLSAPHYNLLAPGNSAIPRKLIELGHDVGLHYDVSAVGALSGEGAVRVLREEARLLGLLSGTPVEVIARHNPGLGGEDPMERATDLISAYDPRFTSEIPYVSDSGGAWRDDTAALFATEEPPRRLQLLVHPIFWDERATDRWTHLEYLRQAQLDEIEAQAAVARDLWTRHPGVAEHERRIRR